MYDEERDEIYRKKRKYRDHNQQRESVSWEDEIPPFTPTREDRDPFLTRNYRKLFLVPFILILTAIVVMGASNYPNPPNSNDYDDYDNYQDDLELYNNIINAIQNTADLLFTLGILILSFLFLMVPFAEPKFPLVLKITMMAIGVLIITHFLTDGLKMQVVFG